MTLAVGLNPYGLTYTLGLQGNPGTGLEGFLEIAGRSARGSSSSTSRGSPELDLAALPASTAWCPWSAAVWTRRATTPRSSARRAGRARRADGAHPGAPGRPARGRLAAARRRRPRAAGARRPPGRGGGAEHRDREPPGLHQRRPDGAVRGGRRRRRDHARHRQRVPGRRGAARVRPHRRPAGAARAPQGLPGAAHRRGLPPRPLRDRRRRGPVPELVQILGRAT